MSRPRGLLPRLWSHVRSAARHVWGPPAGARPAARRARPQVEALEGKVLPSATALFRPPLAAIDAAPAAVRTLSTTTPAPTVGRFNGYYRLTFTGTVATPNGPGTVRGYFTNFVLNGKISAPGTTGGGRITADGRTQQAVAYNGLNLKFQGQATMNPVGSVSVGGTWAGTYRGLPARGTWHAVRYYRF